MKNKIYMLNAISLNLVNTDKVDFFMVKTSIESAKEWMKGKTAISAVRHDLQHFAKEIAKDAKEYKEVSELKFSEPMAYQIVVIQYKGPRLPEGATSLPNGAKLEIWEGIIRIY